ncbi:TPA: relaxase/mobilization nuclease domain-containing protein [Vibrio parahaemolyticus]|uniref:relaxase/mobilization nuclease domain-containing protein n=2 Tax=Vibrio parahaemolyticus TaxID=670 RepID=UPI001A8C589F|nr:relaxase/mobilization nuclease domain-containing protein [Vibrio parahaemolyticus]HDY7620495.1 relaxase/mobilization nuclease domain-containing protein [Vibrio vulnificus]MBO0158705.1 relaxase/mobilization nuclease domain-containing protein [Vibrio parahaemolyticus]MBO0173485.1 relaxase/mobilization nuclease domain-containing protein [Vibrio parahaemolyticus]HCE1577108.1 relaxase/mobilization nuclease domain-containing protein [Vibrio parahaemolyticus]HCE1578602.1 relaxase/mobilization nucl
MVFTELECTRSQQTAKDAQNLVEYGAKQKDADNLVKYGAGKTKHAPASEGHSFFICANEIDSIPVSMGELATGADWHDAITELQSSYKHNPTVKHPFRHFVISIDAGEHLTDKQWRKTVRKTMNRLGYKNARYVAFRHEDTDSQHVHITVSTQDLETNKVISNWMSVETAQEVMREQEKEYGLRQLENSASVLAKGEAVTSDKYSHSVKLMMRRLVESSIKELPSLVQARANMLKKLGVNDEHTTQASLALYQIALLRNGVEIILKEDRNNEKYIGLVYKYNDFIIPASKLRSGNKFTLGGLIKSGVLTSDANMISSYDESQVENYDLREMFESQKDFAEQRFQTVRRDAEAHADKVKKQAEEWDKHMLNCFIISGRKQYQKEIEDAIDFWLYHGKRINKRDKAFVHTIYEQEKGIYSASRTLSKFFYHLLLILFELSKREHWELKVTPVATHEGQELAIEQTIENIEKMYKNEGIFADNKKQNRELNTRKKSKDIAENTY